MALTIVLSVADNNGDIVLTNQTTGYGVGNPLRTQVEMIYSGVKVDKDGNETAVGMPEYDPFTDDVVTLTPAEDGYYKFSLTDGTDSVTVEFVSTAKLEVCRDSKEEDFKKCGCNALDGIDPYIKIKAALGVIARVVTDGYYLKAESLVRKASAFCDLEDECKGC